MKKECHLEGCDGASVARRLCASHYKRWSQHGDGFDVSPVTRRVEKPDGCMIQGCTKGHYCYLLCSAHYSACNTYGLTAIQLQTLYLGRCGICSSPEDLHVDHDHSCCPVGSGKKCGRCVRGVLCRRCNLALGGFHDSPLVLGWALDYLGGAGYKPY